jgi:multisubunit Na+/H+ antiporter MnhC subunit
LIQVKAPGGAAASLCRQPEGEVMPIETVFVIVGIVVAFSLFATALAWADVYSHRARRRRRPNEA